MDYFHLIVFALVAVVTVASAAHALLYKRDPRAALGWVTVCLLFPLTGAIAYALFGINRVRTRARELDNRPARRRPRRRRREAPGTAPGAVAEPGAFAHPIAHIAWLVTGRVLEGGHAITVLVNGEQAYPAMLDAIARAERRVLLCTYIFEVDDTGQAFVEALAAAKERGVEVRVIVDGIGERYSRPRASAVLAERGIPTARFLRPRLLPPTLNVNLRNHRKILVVDGHTAFTGGMNISDRHRVSLAPVGRAVSDLHFRLQGPVVGQLAELFFTDWAFCRRERTNRAAPPQPRSPAGTRTGAHCRVIRDGPNEDMEKLASILLGAIACAKRRIVIVTPYFLPSREMISSLIVATLRGVEVEVFLPARNNLKPVHWATRNLLWELVEHGVRVRYQPPPFAHTKLFLVDEDYAQIGSANFDPRSLRLNFELMVEVYDRDFARRMQLYLAALRRDAHLVSLEELESRPLPVRLRDALCWLASPYL